MFIVPELLDELMPKENYVNFGMVPNDKIYRSVLLSTKSSLRGQGIAGKVSMQPHLLLLVFFCR